MPGTCTLAPLPADRPLAHLFTATDARGLVTSSVYTDLPKAAGK